MNLVQKAVPQRVRISSEKTPAVFFGKLLQTRDIAHLTHLRQPDLKLGTHKALNKLYEDILDTTDTIIESWQGIHGLIDIIIPQSAHRMDPVEWVQETYDYIMSERAMFKESWIQNEIDNICTLIAQTLYRLKYTK